MRKICILICVLFLTVTSFSQTNKTSNELSIKVAMVYSDDFFNDKSGINDLIIAKRNLNEEFSSQVKEIESLATKINRLEKELQSFQETNASRPGIMESKLNEHEMTVCEAKEKINKLKISSKSRREEIFGQINDKISKTLKQFAEEKGFEIIIDRSKSSEFDVVSNSYPDVTVEFIEFYNNLK